MRIWIVLLLAGTSFAQPALQEKIRAIAREAKGQVSAACSLPESRLNCDLNPHAHPPMQSVFKLPLAVFVMHRIEQGAFTLDQPVRFLAEDRILPRAYSPLNDRYPEGNVDVPLRELLRYAVVQSDNVAADILLRISGGPKATNDYLAALGVRGLQLRDNENTLHHDVSAQYRNWFEPAGAVQFLRILNDHSPLTADHAKLLLGWMEESRAARLKIRLPDGVRVFHKAGTSSVDDGLAHATNDIGLIELPDGRRLAIAVFVTDSRADERTRERVIAEIGRAAYDGR